MDKKLPEDEDDYNEDDDDKGHIFVNNGARDCEEYFNFSEFDQNMKEIIDLLDAHSQVNCSNALALNQQMQHRLLDVRQRLQTLLQTVQERYVANEKRLRQSLSKKNRGIGMRGAYLKGGTFYFKGNMFFKDLNCRNCPHNADYEQRKSEGEIFPMDFELSGRHVWSMMDKMGIVQAIKEQVIDYLADREKKLPRTGSKTDKCSKQIAVHSDKLVNLLAQVDDNFHIDWEQISAHNLRFRHTPSSCQTMWQVYLHPSLRRQPWTAEEKQRLLEAARANQFQNWPRIAEMVGKRSDYQCFVEYQTSVCYMEPQRFGRWDKSDDTKLLQLIEKNNVNGVINWNVVASHFPHKSKPALHQRYAYSLNPKISHAPFTPEEDLILLAAVEEYGEYFSSFPRTLFPNRSLIQLRSRYKDTLRTRHVLTPWSVEDDQKLMEFVAANGTASWLQCARTLGNHNRTGCRTRFLTIQKFFQKHPNAVLEDLPRKKVRTVKNSIITTENWVEKLAELRENPDVDLTPKSLRSQRKAVETDEEGGTSAGTVKQSKEPKPQKKTKQEPNAEATALLQQQRMQGITQLAQRAPKRDRRMNRPHLYVNRLRAIERNLYHFFKYAYNFRLGTDPCTQPCASSLYTVVDALGLCVSQHKPYVHDYTMPLLVRQRCKAYLQHYVVEKKLLGYRLPPSWSTAMGFRALCIQAAQVNTEARTSPPAHQANLDSHEAVQLFRLRLRALFYRTTLLSRLQPSIFPQLSRPSVTSAKHQKQPTEPEAAEQLASLKHSAFEQVEEDELKIAAEEDDSHEFRIVEKTQVGEFTIATVVDVKQETTNTDAQPLSATSVAAASLKQLNVIKWETVPADVLTANTAKQSSEVAEVEQLTEIDTLRYKCKRRAPTEKAKNKRVCVSSDECRAQPTENSQQLSLQSIKTEIEM